MRREEKSPIFIWKIVKMAEKRSTSETAVTISGFTIGMLVTVTIAFLIYFFLNYASPSAASVPINVAIKDEATARAIE